MAPCTVCQWFKNEKKLGREEAIRGRRRGRKPGFGRLLDPEQEAEVQEVIMNSYPWDHGLDFELWTRRALQAWILQKYGIKISFSGLSYYLKRWGMSFQRPCKQAIEQNPEKVKEWQTKIYPEIAERAKKEGAIIYWSDETGVKKDSNWLGGFSRKGHTPVLKIQDGRWKSATRISAISNEGVVRYKIQDKPMNQETFIEFLEQLLKEEPRKIFLIVDNLAVHKSKAVREWVQERKDRIELFYLPPYSPEQNPDEFVNRAVKTEIRSRVARSQSVLKEKVASFMAKLSKDISMIKSMFQFPTVSYTEFPYLVSG